jgi:Holliday junction DNA helicase RuvA
MIANLRGQVIGKGKDSVVIEVNGVGYRVVVPRRLLSAWEGSGAEVQVHTYLHVRENELALYGSDTEEELELFQLLLGVTGIGPKAAMSILSDLSPTALCQAIASEDTASLASVSGVGTKTAKKIIFHLKDKFALEEGYRFPSDAEKSWESEVVAALTALGYTLGEARAAVASLPADDIEFEERLRLALRYFAK